MQCTPSPNVNVTYEFLAELYTNRIYIVLDVGVLKGLRLKSLCQCDVNFKPSSPLVVPYSLYPAQKFSITYDFLVQLYKFAVSTRHLTLGMVGTRTAVSLDLRCKFKANFTIVIALLLISCQNFSITYELLVHIYRKQYLYGT